MTPKGAMLGLAPLAPLGLLLPCGALRVLSVMGGATHTLFR